MHRTFVGCLERVECNVGIDSLGVIAAAFGISVGELLDGPFLGESGGREGGESPEAGGC